MSGWKKVTAGAAFFAVVLVGLPGVAGCGSVPVVCAGQCQPPFEFVVTFKPGTSPGAASSELRRCSRGDANVIRIHEFPPVNGQPRAEIYTHSMPKLGPDGLLKCLYAEAHVLRAGFPD